MSVRWLAATGALIALLAVTMLVLGREGSERPRISVPRDGVHGEPPSVSRDARSTGRTGGRGDVTPPAPRPVAGVQLRPWEHVRVDEPYEASATSIATEATIVRRQVNAGGLAACFDDTAVGDLKLRFDVQVQSTGAQLVVGAALLAEIEDGFPLSPENMSCIEDLSAGHDVVAVETVHATGHTAFLDGYVGTVEIRIHVVLSPS
jgi:hypothetical protein